MTTVEKWEYLYAMKTMEKWEYLYDNYDMRIKTIKDLDRWKDLPFIEDNVAKFEQEWFRPLLSRAQATGDNGAVEYLLEAGVSLIEPPGSPASCDWIAVAVAGNNWSLARLVRRHGAAMNHLAMEYLTRAFERAAQEPGATPGSLMTYLRDFPDDQRALVPCLSQMSTQQLQMGHGVRASWPPSADPPTPPVHATALPPNIVELVRELWHKIGRMRRAEAKVLSFYNWTKVRRVVRARAIAIYWQGVTQEAQCAPNGSGRSADLVAYRAEFAHLLGA